MYYVKMKGQDTLMLAIIGVIAGIAFIGGFSFGEMNYEYFKSGYPVVYSSDDNIVAAGYGSQLDTLGYDEYKIIYDENEYNYTLSFDSYAGLYDSYFEIKYGQEKNLINLNRYFLADGRSETHQLEFDKPVVDSFIAGFGENNDRDSIVFILEDGSVEYILVGRAMKNNDYRTFQINGLQNIAKHYNANACSDVNSVCVRTTLVQAMDGTIYNLANYIQ